MENPQPPPSLPRWKTIPPTFPEPQGGAVFEMVLDMLLGAFDVGFRQAKRLELSTVRAKPH